MCYDIFGELYLKIYVYLVFDGIVGEDDGKFFGVFVDYFFFVV